MKIENNLRIWWSQLPNRVIFNRSVKSPSEGLVALELLADYDLHLENAGDLNSDCNIGGLEVFVDDEWCEWENGDGLTVFEIEEQS